MERFTAPVGWPSTPMPAINEQLRRSLGLVELAEVVRTGTAPTITPRSLIGWFGAQRRGVWISARVKEALEHLGLETFPDFEYEWIDGPISVRKATPKSPPEAATQSGVLAENDVEPTDPTYRIGKLEALRCNAETNLGSRRSMARGPRRTRVPRAGSFTSAGSSRVP